MVTWTGEAEPGFPYWWEALKEIAEPEDCPLPPRVDLLVIGAGYAGLSAALAAQDCGATVAVVDSVRPGDGASTRNGGMFGAHPRLSWPRLAAQFGEETADALFAEAAPARAFVLDLIEREGIACDLQRTGRIQLAWARSHLESQKRLARDVRDKSEVEVETLDRAATTREIATERYFGGLLFPDHCAIHPAKFHRGLWAGAVDKGITVTANAAVTGYTREGGGFSVETLRGPVRADKIVLATNGYTPGFFRWHVARVFPLPSYIIATEELPSNLIGHLAPGRRMMVETRARHSYFRISPDGKRILFGGRASMRDIPLDLAARRQHVTMCEVWPELRDAKLSHVWSGNTGYSFTEMPHVGEDRGLHFAMGFSGSGTVMAPYLGAKAAFRAMGDARGETAYARTPFRRHWLHPTTTPHFLRAADLWYRSWVDTRDRMAGR
ncbi:FAD-binding oxidoreductase [Roseovarius sp. SCSIO 43702]|uniref:NAD(P)/FAD-dependent oxidoreductase n=1 Tax=Roseovarius sp. SCSIO 43702 TaxID=2823043 RepID=UPI001C733717|nr:FAD-binding oxidoreductase [Roseovarius sp. SCSIO 43702]QYX57520.1 FAD-binding oxidoreductase [Roseovarius sp. SCSIO 43702]